jgi:hypothetical protein
VSQPTSQPTSAGQQAALLQAGAAEYTGLQQAATAAVLASVLAAWATLDAGRAIASWEAGIGERIYVLISMAQELFARDANSYVRRSLGLMGLTYRGGDVVPLNFAGIASDGRDLESLLAGAVVNLRQSQRAGESEARARERGANFLRLAGQTQVADAARAAEGVSITASEPTDRTGKKVEVGWIRVLNPPSCSRCVLLAGRFYRWNEGFERHPNCFPAGTVVSGPKIDAATRRWFEGELVTIRTASGQEISVTGNHPVLTDGGWLPARLLQPGDHVVRSFGARSAFLEIPGHQQVPSRIEDVFGALSMTSSVLQVPSTTEDFHGDGSGGEVDVVAADGLLGDGRQPLGGQALEELSLPLRAEGPDCFSTQCGSEQGLVGLAGPQSRDMGSGGLGGSLFGRHLPGAHQASIRVAANLYAVPEQARAQGVPTDVVFATERVLALASRILRRDFGNRQDEVAARWDAPAGSFSVETCDGYASQGKDLLLRLAGQVALDRVVEKVSRQWSGHVYNLTSSEGWMSSNGIIFSNCDCRHVPATEAVANPLLTDPMLYFNSLTPAEQDRYFGAGPAQAIRDGAAVDRTVNATGRARNSVYTADDGKRYTKELARDGVRRPTPDQIYKDANGDKAAAITALKKFGYVAGGSRRS